MDTMLPLWEQRATALQRIRRRSLCGARAAASAPRGRRSALDEYTGERPRDLLPAVRPDQLLGLGFGNDPALASPEGTRPRMRIIGVDAITPQREDLHI